MIERMGHRRTRCLSIHAEYECRRTGVCCRSGWDIPFDSSEVQAVRALGLSGRVLLEPAGDKPAFATRGADGACTFFDAGARACVIHAAGGHDALPLTCRMFPRVVLHDARGTFVSLSHFCPTAASMLFDADRPVSIIDAPAGLTRSAPLDGLDATDSWPPLLRDGVLADLDSYARWEEQSISLLTMSGAGARASLAQLGVATAGIARWVPADGALLDTVERAFAALPDPPRCAGAPHEAAVQRWLAARLFGTWIAYQGRGLMTIVRYLEMCLKAFERELEQSGDPLQAIRSSDYHIVHESSSQRLAMMCDAREA
jgi:Fe-S-cluster containining protein